MDDETRETQEPSLDAAAEVGEAGMRTIMVKVKFPCTVDFFAEVCSAAARHLPPECRGGRAVVGETDADGFTPIYATTDKEDT